MASKVFKLDISRIGRRARNKRLRESGQGGGISGVVLQRNGGETVQGDGHTHGNLAVLNKLGADDNSYIYLDQQRLTEDGNGTQTVSEKAKAGWADDAGKWAGHEFGDWMDQPVRKDDDVEFASVGTQQLDVSGEAAFHGAETHEGGESHAGDETHVGDEMHEGDETHRGTEIHEGDETHEGGETHGGHVEVTQKLSINENALAQILGAMFLGRSTEFVSGVNGHGGKIGKQGTDWQGELDSILVRKLATMVRGVFSELVSANPTDKTSAFFLQGFNGHGAKVWYDDETGWNMELDTLTVRRIMYIFELVIQKIRSVGGILIVSAANGKIKEVQKVKCEINGTYQEYFKIRFEDTNTFISHDLMRCQRWNNGRYDDVTKEDDAELPDARAMQYYWVEVAFPDSIAFNQNPDETPEVILLCDDNWNLVREGGNTIDVDFSTAYDILVPRSEFGKTVTVEVEGEETTLPADTEPEVGDDCVLMGNTQYVKRQNYIYISATEDGVPRIDVMDGCSRKGDGGNLRCRLGCLDGIEDDHWTGTVKPNGYGLYSDNAWLKGKFVVRINGVDREVGTMFEVLDGMVRSSVSAMREDMIGGEGCISNNIFSDGWAKWNIYAGGQIFSSGGLLLSDGVSLLSDLGSGAYARLVEGDERSYVELKSASGDSRGIVQRNADMHDIPEFETQADENDPNQDVVVPKTFAVSFYAQAVNTAAIMVVKLGDSVKNLTVGTGKWQKKLVTMDWDGTGDFTIRSVTTNAVRIYGFVVSEDVTEALVDKMETVIRQLPNSIEGIANAFRNVDGSYELISFADFMLNYGRWQTEVNSKVLGANSTLAQLADSITLRVGELEGNILFKKTDADFGYCDASSTDVGNDPEELALMIYSDTDANGDFLHVEEQDTGESISFRLGLLSTAQQYDGRAVRLRFRASGSLNIGGSVKIYYGAGQDGSEDEHVDITSRFSGGGIVDGFVNFSFNYHYGVRIRVCGGWLKLYAIGAELAVNHNHTSSHWSMIEQKARSILSFVGSNYVSSSSLAEGIARYLTEHNYATKNDVSSSVSGVMSKETFNTIFSGIYNPTTGVLDIAAGITTLVRYRTDGQGNVMVDAQGNKFIEGKVLVGADNIRLEGYTSINEKFKVDLEGNATMKDCTVEGVLNNLIQKKVFMRDEREWNLNPLRWGSIIEYTPGTEGQGDESMYYLNLPSLFTEGGKVYIEYKDYHTMNGASQTFKGITAEQLRQCIGKKFYIFSTISTEYIHLRISSYLLVQKTSGELTSFTNKGDNADMSSTPQYRKVAFAEASASQVVILECKLGDYNARECIYWEVENSVERSDTTLYVYGRVVDRSNSSVVGFEVELINTTDPNDKYSATTDELGYYACQIPAGTYGVSVIDAVGRDYSIEDSGELNTDAIVVEGNSVCLNMMVYR